MERLSVSQILLDYTTYIKIEQLSFFCRHLIFHISSTHILTHILSTHITRSKILRITNTDKQIY